MLGNKLAKQKAGPPTQQYLDIAEVREDIVVMKDGTLRAVLMVSSINFALKSQDEQQATIQAYMQFLNGLEYPVQIVVQSRKMNIDAYMQALDEQEKKISNELLKVQIRDYRSFVSDLVELGEIMQKRFYLVIPYDPATDKQRNFWAKLQEAISPAKIVKLKAEQFAERKTAIMQRVNILSGALGSMSLQTAMLDTQSLIELYYSVYNPQVFDRQKISDTTKVRLEEGF
ncbi:MAG: TraC family protein [Patescibacteria group bacterium]|jgi:hypothetical protein